MADITDQLEVKHEWHTGRMVFLGLVVAAILVSAAAIPFFNDFRSRAKPLETPVLLSSARPTPPADLSAPYLRLVVAQARYLVGETVPVDIYLSTSDKPTMEATVKLKYPADILTLQKDEVVSDEVYKSFQVDMPTDGQATLDFFNTPSVGHKPVITQGEQKIGTLKFTVIGKSNLVTLDIVKTKSATESSQLVPFSTTRDASASNLLQAVRGVSFQTE